MMTELLSRAALPCLCANFRRAARALTQLYDDALRPAGLRATQFTVLQALELAGEVSQGELGRLLVMDSTTLTRTLRLLSSHGWIEARPGEDRRERRLRLAAAGRRQLARALPRWERVQARLRSRTGERRWRELMSASVEVCGRVQKTVEH
ncbi:MAG TPA: MarR family transcriptional regulator [Terriglobales bacterium]|nr:MarR family transcriptional regulator [Terriglobales bacterium]